jgi:hypothetical protein
MSRDSWLVTGVHSKMEGTLHSPFYRVFSGGSSSLTSEQLIGSVVNNWGLEMRVYTDVKISGPTSDQVIKWSSEQCKRCRLVSERIEGIRNLEYVVYVLNVWTASGVLRQFKLKPVEPWTLNSNPCWLILSDLGLPWSRHHASPTNSSCPFLYGEPGLDVGRGLQSLRSMSKTWRW